nr:hypothetical protein [Morchella crassipes]
MAVLGINYSRQVEDRKAELVAFQILRAGGNTSLWGLISLLWKDYRINNDKGSSINLRNEINETNGMLGKKSDSETRSVPPLSLDRERGEMHLSSYGERDA